eukprot:g10096.t1
MPSQVKTAGMATTGGMAPGESLYQADAVNPKRQRSGGAGKPAGSTKKAKTTPTVQEFALVLRSDKPVDERWCKQRQQCRQVYEDIASSEEKLVRLLRRAAECKEDELRALNSTLLQGLVGASSIAEPHRLAMERITKLGCDSCCYYPCDQCGELNHSDEAHKCVCGLSGVSNE